MYLDKPRNWHYKKWVKLFLDTSHKWGVQRADYYNDGDRKYILKTHHFAIAVLT
jgi:hypothetical protein